jgi:hypothetical protein
VRATLLVRTFSPIKKWSWDVWQLEGKRTRVLWLINSLSASFFPWYISFSPWMNWNQCTYREETTISCLSTRDPCSVYLMGGLRVFWTGPSFSPAQLYVESHPIKCGQNMCVLCRRLWRPTDGAVIASVPSVPTCLGRKKKFATTKFGRVSLQRKREKKRVWFHNNDVLEGPAWDYLWIYIDLYTARIYTIYIKTYLLGYIT